MTDWTAYSSDSRLARGLQFVVPACVAGVAVGMAVSRGDGLVFAGGLLLLWLLVASFSRPVLAVCGLILLSPLVGNIAIVQVSDLPDVTLDRLLCFWCVLVLVRSSRQVDVGSPGTPSRILATGLGPWALLWVAVLTASLAIGALRSSDQLAGIQLWLDQCALPVALLIAAARCAWSKTQWRAVLAAFVLAGCLWSGAAIAEVILRRSLFISGGQLPWTPQGSLVVRTGGPFGNPAVLGIAMGVVFALSLGALWGRDLRLGVCIVGMAASLFGLAVTLTRASWLAFGVGLVAAVLLARPQGRIRIAFGALLAVMVGYSILVSVYGLPVLESRLSSQDSGYNRLVGTSSAVSLALDNPVFGIGIGEFYQVSQQPGVFESVMGVSSAYGIGVRAPHNSIVDAAVSAGLVAAAAVIALWVALLRRFLRIWKWGATRSIGAAGVLILTLFAVNALFIDVSLTNHINGLVLLVLGVMAGRAASERLRLQGEVT